MRANGLTGGEIQAAYLRGVKMAEARANTPEDPDGLELRAVEIAAELGCLLAASITAGAQTISTNAVRALEAGGDMVSLTVTLHAIRLKR